MNNKAVDLICSQASLNEKSDRDLINTMLKEFSIEADADLLVKKLLYSCDVTLNFHPTEFHITKNWLLKICLTRESTTINIKPA